MGRTAAPRNPRKERSYGTSTKSQARTNCTMILQLFTRSIYACQGPSPKRGENSRGESRLREEDADGDYNCPRRDQGRRPGIYTFSRARSLRSLADSTQLQRDPR